MSSLRELTMDTVRYSALGAERSLRASRRVHQ
jgi:hypothetical protein